MTMRSLKTLVLAGAVLTGATAVALAADLGPPPVHGGLPAAPHAAPIAEASGWYLRGDIGFGAIDAIPTITSPIGFPAVPPTVNGHKPSFGNYGVIGAGVGYQWNNWFRTDLTADFRTFADTKFGDKYCFATGAGLPNISTAGASCAGLPAGYTAGQNGFNAYNGRISAMTFLANGYLDLGTWNGLTPYIGAGAGFANVRVNGLTDQGVNQDLVTGVTSPVATAYYANKSKTNFAWALMAGVGYDVSQSLKLELGYRYVNMGKIKDIAGCGNPSCGVIGFKELDAHEVRIGMRWMLGGPSYAAAPMSYPAAEPRMIKKF
jgi:opacity protein-like surface antigen